MPTDAISLVGSLPKLRAEDARRIGVYIVRGAEVLAHTSPSADGTVRFTIARASLAQPSAFGLQVVVGPAGLGQHLDQVPNLQRVPLNAEELAKASEEFRLHFQGVSLSDEILKIWWLWCRQYCVDGVVVGPDGCPVPGANVTIYSVAHDGGGFSEVPRATVTTDATGHFHICFNW